MKVLELINLYDDWNGDLVINDSNLNQLHKGKIHLQSNYLKYHDSDVESFGFYDGELCIRISESNNTEDSEISNLREFFDIGFKYPNAFISHESGIRVYIGHEGKEDWCAFVPSSLIEKKIGSDHPCLNFFKDNGLVLYCISKRMCLLHVKEWIEYAKIYENIQRRRKFYEKEN